MFKGNMANLMKAIRANLSEIMNKKTLAKNLGWYYGDPVS